MSWRSLLAIAVALSMDAFAVAIVVGMTLKVFTRRHLFRLSFHFGLFQAAMLAAGWLVGHALHDLLAAVDHWVAFALLFLVGANVIRDSFHDTDPTKTSLDPTSGWHLVFLSVATSIDALAVGLTLALLGTSIAISAAVVGSMAAVLTLLGMALGRRVGALWGKRIEVLGGLVLIAIGCKILWDHLMG
jgi:putative Mn2+ efflux pump MntP